MTLGIEPTTFRIVAQCLIQLRYHVCVSERESSDILSPVDNLMGRNMHWILNVRYRNSGPRKQNTTLLGA
jgi:hypothetical protein